MAGGVTINFFFAGGCLGMSRAELFFLLAAAWVDPGRSALQSAEQWCKGRNGQMHQVVKCHFMTKTCKRPLKQHTKPKSKGRKPSTKSASTAEEGYMANH